MSPISTQVEVGTRDSRTAHLPIQTRGATAPLPFLASSQCQTAHSRLRQSFGEQAHSTSRSHDASAPRSLSLSPPHPRGGGAPTGALSSVVALASATRPITRDARLSALHR